MLNILAIIILTLSCLAGFVAIFFTTFGTLIILCGTIIYSAMTSFEVVTFKLLLVIFVLYLIGELCEYLFIVLGTKKAGSSNAAVVGAMVGAVPGAILGAAFFGIGIILGTFLGIFLGAFLVELFLHGDLRRSLLAGTGGVLGRVGSIVAKIFIALTMMGLVFWKMAGFS